jgi:putative transcriptional regulator
MVAREQARGTRSRAPRARRAAALIGASAAALLLAAGLAGPAAAQSPRDGKAILLVADPGLPDPNFRETVVLVSGHRGVAGPIGVIINRPTSVTLARALPDIKAIADLEDKVYFGGPVATQGLFYVFRADQRPDDAIEVAPGVYLDWDGGRLKALLARDKPTEGLRVYAGHSAWAPGQLEAEVARGFWKSARPEERIIFSSKPETLWTELERRTRATPVRLEARSGINRGAMP